MPIQINPNSVINWANYDHSYWALDQQWANYGDLRNVCWDVSPQAHYQHRK